MRIVSKTDKGKTRRSNQDAYATGELCETMSWAVVCDGMGGVQGGNVAAVTAVKVVSEHISNSFREGMSSTSIRIMLETAISKANIEVYDLAQSSEILKGMGTTIVACVIKDAVAHIVHVGDSRAYLVSDSKVEQVTKDHSLVQSLIDQGKITEQEAVHHPQKNIITRALGVEDRILVDYDEVMLCEGESLMICSDGLTNCVDSEQLLSIVKNNKFYDYPDLLVKQANSNGGTDNITVVFLSL